MKNNLAPIVLFVYNRPSHTRKTLEALSKNTLADESDLYVFCDGPKDNADELTLDAITKVRTIVKAKKWCKSVTVYESEQNNGLADSIITGVTEIVNRFGKIIVLEDDIITAKGFLKYMNNALDLYQYEDKVMHIGSYLPYTNSVRNLPETFFLKFMSCWGWATWKESWNLAIWDTAYLFQKVQNPKVRDKFNLGGVLNFHEQLENNINGKIKTWAIKWYTTIFLKEGLCLYPNISLSNNIGLDGTGENCNIEDDKASFHADNEVQLNFQFPKESKLGRKYLQRFYQYGLDSSWRARLKRNYIQYRFMLIKQFIKK